MDPIQDTDPEATRAVLEQTAPPAAPESQIEEPVEQPEAPEAPAEEEAGEQPEETRGTSAKERIQELAHEKNELRGEVRNLRDELTQFDNPYNGFQPPVAPFIPQVQPGQEITLEQYQQDVARAASSVVELRLQQERNMTRQQNELAQSMDTYKALNPDAKDFDQDLSNSVTEAVAAYMRANPTGSPKKFIDNMMKPYMKSVEKAVGNQTATVAKQVAQTALRPTQVKSSEKSAKDMTLEELEQKLGKVF